MTNLDRHSISVRLCVWVGGVGWVGGINVSFIKLS